MEALQKRIGYQFRDINLLARALTHPSLAKKVNNQRLEFLGDAVIALIVARILYWESPSFLRAAYENVSLLMDSIQGARKYRNLQ